MLNSQPAPSRIVSSKSITPSSKCAIPNSNCVTPSSNCATPSSDPAAPSLDSTFRSALDSESNRKQTPPSSQAKIINPSPPQNLHRKRTLESFVAEPSKPSKSTSEKKTSTSSSSIENPSSSNDDNCKDSKFDYEPNPSFNALLHQMIGSPPVLDGERVLCKTCSVGSASYKSPFETSEPSTLRYNIVNEDVMNVSQPLSEMNDRTAEVNLKWKKRCKNKKSSQNKKVTKTYNPSDSVHEDLPHTSHLPDTANEDPPHASCPSNPFYEELLHIVIPSKLASPPSSYIAWGVYGN